MTDESPKTVTPVKFFRQNHFYGTHDAFGNKYLIGDYDEVASFTSAMQPKHRLAVDTLTVNGQKDNYITLSCDGGKTQHQASLGALSYRLFSDSDIGTIKSELANAVKKSSEFNTIPKIKAASDSWNVDGGTPLLLVFEKADPLDHVCAGPVPALLDSKSGVRGK